MILDMHCHTAEGSPDALVDAQEAVDILKLKGYNGMLVTDHNSYKGFNSLEKLDDDFIILRGVEYDTKDGGHMLIILPTGMDYEIFTLRGMNLEDVIKIVHALGGIIGPAHPFDYYKLGLCNNPRWLNKIDLISQLDFIETFNACGREYGNVLARQLAEVLNKPQLGGSDFHRKESVGSGYTYIKENIKNEDDLINLIKRGNFKTTDVGGKTFNNSLLNKHRFITNVGVVGYRVVTQSVAFLSRKKHQLIIEKLGIL